MNFRQQVFAIVRTIPPGYVASYGQIAALAGNPRAARQVGWVLAVLGKDGQDVPWWRVVNREGYLSIRNDDLHAKMKQRSLLQAEGVKVNDDFALDMAIYRWLP